MGAENQAPIVDYRFWNGKNGSASMAQIPATSPADDQTHIDTKACRAHRVQTPQG